MEVGWTAGGRSLGTRWSVWAGRVEAGAGFRGRRRFIIVEAAAGGRIKKAGQTKKEVKPERESWIVKRWE